MALLLHRKLEPHAYLLLDVARYLACLSVFFGHFLFLFVVRIYGLDHTYYNINGFVGAFYFFSHAIGVMVFFVLSGFLIGYKALAEVHVSQRFDLKDYLQRRVFRIIPPLYCSLVFMLFVLGVIKFFHLFGSESYFLTGDEYNLVTKAKVDVGVILKVLFLVPGNTQVPTNVALWSLSYEFYYYLLFAFILVAVVNKNFKQMFYVSSYVIFLPLIFCLVHHAYIPLFVKVFKLSVVWWAGVLIAYLYLTHRSMLQPLVCFGLALGLFIFVYPLMTRMGDVPLELVGGLVATFLIMGLVNFKFTRAPVKILQKLAQGSFYTYTFYLFHFPLMLLVFSLLGPRILHFHWLAYGVLCFGLLLVTNILSYYLAQVLENRAFWVRLLKINSVL
jgi:peptidoglycan/LPS O-acetylase OafA/YrhL